MENDPCNVGTLRNYTAGTGDRQYTSAQAKERNRRAFQRRMAQTAPRIHVAEQETSQICGAEQTTSRISGDGDELRLRAALAELEAMRMLMARVTATLHALQFTVKTPRCPQQPPMDPALCSRGPYSVKI